MDNSTNISTNGQEGISDFSSLPAVYATLIISAVLALERIFYYGIRYIKYSKCSGCSECISSGKSNKNGEKENEIP